MICHDPYFFDPAEMKYHFMVYALTDEMNDDNHDKKRIDR